MDRNTVIGLVLISGILLSWMLFFQPDKPQTPEQPVQKSEIKQEADAVQPTEPDLTELNPALPQDSLQNIALVKKFGAFAPVASGKNNAVRVKTDNLDVKFSEKGGTIVGAYLNKYKTFDHLPLPLIQEGFNNVFFFEFVHTNKRISTNDLYFVPSDSGEIIVPAGSKKTLSFKAEVSPGKYIEQTYTFENGTFDIGYAINLVGLEDLIKNNHYELNWNIEVPKTEKALTNMRSQSAVYYKTGDEIENLDLSSKDPEIEKIKTPIEWVSFKNQFFSAILIPDTAFDGGTVNLATPESEAYNKAMGTVCEVAYRHEPKHSSSYKLFLGPNKFDILKSYGQGLEHQINLGWSFISWINKYIVLNTFRFLEDKIGNYGIIILILALLIRLLILPLVFKSYVSTAKMRIVNDSPEVKALEEKFKEEPTKLQTEKMTYYNSVGVNPLGGCLPLLLQMPIIFAMFSFFPASIELRQQPFLWADDLSSYDSIFELPFSIPFYGSHVSLFTLLMTFSTLVFTYIQQKNQGTSNPQMASFKYVAYFMPVVFMGVLNNYASGLSYYYFVANVLSISQSYLIRYFVNDKKILDQIHEAKKKKKTAKKSRLQGWLEKQQKAQEELKRTRSRNK